MKTTHRILTYSFAATLGSATVWADASCTNCTLPGSCPPTLPMGAGPGEDHSCEDWSSQALEDANLVDADLVKVSFFFTSLQGARLAGANLSGALVQGADAREASFRGADLTNVLMQSADLSNATLYGADLTNATLAATTAVHADFRRANLTGADLFIANLTDAVLNRTDLTDADLGGSTLTRTDLRNADLSHALLASADLTDADLRGCVLAGAGLPFAAVDGASFQGANLEGATGLTSTSGSASYDCATNFEGTGFDPVEAGWILVEVAAGQEVRSGTPANPDAFVPGSTNGPTLGAIWQPSIDHSRFAPTALADFMLISGGPTNLPLGMGTLLCNPAQPPFLLIGNGGAPGDPFQVAIPDNCNLVGTELCTQGGSILPDGTTPLANALDITIGTF